MVKLFSSSTFLTFLKNMKISIEAIISASREKVCEYYTNPQHIIKWNFASEDWCCPSAENDLQIGGKYKARMEAKDKSFGFDFEGVYNEVIMGKQLTYTLGDQRTVSVIFEDLGTQTKITIHFDAENQHSPEIQKNGWQAILNNFKQYAEKYIHE
jgi:uncharacterized protein YndB with AHSA1/START domain